MIFRLLALFGIYIYIYVATDNSRLQPGNKSVFSYTNIKNPSKISSCNM